MRKHLETPESQDEGLLHRMFSWHYAHHLLLAAVIASCTLLFELTGSLNWLDSVTLRLAAASNSALRAEKSSQHPEEMQAAMPATLLIDDSLYEHYFKQASPLSREKLSTLIKALIDNNPKILAIDIDLAPGADDPFGKSKSQRALDKLLDDAARGGCSSFLGSHKESLGCKIVVTLPVPVISETTQELQFDWLKARCAAGIQFATPRLVSHQGMIIRQSVTSPNLGNVSAWWFEDGSSPVTSAEHAETAAPAYRYFCEKVDEYSTGKDFFIWLKLDPVASVNPLALSDKEMAPLNTDYFSSTSNVYNAEFGAIDHLGKMTISIPEIPQANYRAIFLGGSYGVSDQYETAVGQFDGVSIHAAVFFSALHGVAKASHMVAWGLDIIVGLFLGIAFQRMWTKYNQAEKVQKDTELKPLINKISKYVVAKLWLIANFALLISLFVLFLNFASSLLAKGLWLNPGPIAIGMFIDSLLSSRSEGRMNHGAGFNALLKEHPDMIWQFLLVLGTLIYLTTSHH